MDKELLRSGISSEMEPINLYEQMHAFAENKDIKKLILEIIEEGKSRVGRLQAMLLINDQEQKIKLEEGAKKIQEMLLVHKSISKLPEEKKPEKQLSINKDEISEVKEPEVEKGADINPPETKESSTKMKHEAVEMMLCGVCNHRVKASAPIRCPLCGAPSGRMKRI